MSRLERIRAVVDQSLSSSTNEEALRNGFIHLYGVSATATLLARLRGLDEELAGVAGMLHDLVTYESGDAKDHAARSATRASEILSDLDCFTEEEIACIHSAIFHHSDKASHGNPYEELLKDADVLQHDLYDPSFPPYSGHETRRLRLREQFRPRVTP